MLKETKSSSNGQMVESISDCARCDFNYDITAERIIQLEEEIIRTKNKVAFLQMRGFRILVAVNCLGF